MSPRRHARVNASIAAVVAATLISGGAPGAIWLRFSRPCALFAAPLDSFNAKVRGPRCLQTRCLVARGAGTVRLAELFASQWADEAKWCWGDGSIGENPGWIADMMPPFKQFEPNQRQYYEREKPRDNYKSRPWKTISEQDRVTRRFNKFKVHEQAGDYEIASRLFERGEPESKRGGIMVDLGCGNAIMARRFAQEGAFDQVYALDIMKNELEIARNEAESEFTGPADGLFMVRADAQDLPFRDGQVDYVWWGLGIHKVEDASVALEKILAALRPGGRLVATTRSTLMSDFEIKMLAKRAGYSDVSVTTVSEGTWEERLVLTAVRPAS